jgi:hypothetical protein
MSFDGRTNAPVAPSPEVPETIVDLITAFGGRREDFAPLNIAVHPTGLRRATR